MRRTAKGVGLDLPELTRSTQLCDMRHFQREHDDVLGSAGAEQIIRAVVSGAVRAVLPVLTRLRKLTSEAKFKATLEYVDNLVEQGESVVVFCWERETAKQFYNNAWAAESYLATGEQEQSVRDFAVASFQQDGGVMCATYGALREGVTLHQARVVVLHDLDWTLSAMLQAEKRIHRIGQKRGCQSVWMVADNSIDTLLLPVLHQKASAMQDVLGMDEGSEALEALGLVPEDQVEVEVQSALRAWEAM
jgi:SNF2 family DNA or RNA helicase